jgi:hypothetical protein
VTAIADPALFASGQRAKAFALTRAAGATYARLTVAWRVIAPSTRPDGFVATDPGSPGYSWGGLDAAVQAADAAGLTAILDISSVPRWAYSRQPHSPNAGTPRATALGDFATALAKHYDGSTAGVPAEHVFQVWNEPNLSLDLYPISTKSYRKMVNAVADAVHAVDPANLLVAGALEPVGHQKRKGQKWYSIAPLAFMRSLLCVSKGRTRTRRVATPSTSTSGRTTRTRPGPVRPREDPRRRDARRPAEDAGAASGRSPVSPRRLGPPRPLLGDRVRLGHAPAPPERGPARARGALDRRVAPPDVALGVSLVTWYLLQDYPSPSPYQSGSTSTRIRSTTRGRRRASPPSASRSSRTSQGRPSHLGRVATSDERTVGIQLRHGKHGSWQTVASIESNRYGIFRAKLPIRASKKDWLRATAPGSRTSLAFSLTRPKNPARIGPWGY